MMKEEQELRDLADEQSNKQDQMLSNVIKGKFSPDKANTFVNALDKVVSLFGDVSPSPRFKDTIKSFPPEVVAKVFAVMEALKQFDTEGSYEMPSPDQVSNDNDLVVVMMILDKLSKDSKFKKFLKKPVEMEIEMGSEKEDSMEESKVETSPEQETELSIMFGEE